MLGSQSQEGLVLADRALNIAGPVQFNREGEDVFRLKSLSLRLYLLSNYRHQ